VPDRRLSLAIVLLVLVSLVSAVGAYQLIGVETAATLPEMRDVVIANRDVPEGQALEREQLRLAPVPVSLITGEAFANLDSVIGRVTRAAIFRGEVVVPGRLAPSGSGSGIEVKIPVGKRAMAVRIDEVAGLAGLIQPNSRVDVLVTLMGSGSAAPQTKLFMSNLRVLSIGSQVERGADGAVLNATTATLEVTPQDAEQLALAANQGKIQLVLRGFGDPEVIETDGATIRSLTRAAEVVTPVASPARRPPTPPRPEPTSDASRERTPPPAAARPDSLVVRIFERDRASTTSVMRPTRADSLRTP